MNPQRYNQRRPVAPQPLQQGSNDSNRTEVASLVLPSQAIRGQVFARNNHLSQANSADELKAKFEKVCKEFFEAVFRLQIIAFLLFFPLMVFTQILEDANFAVIFYFYVAFGVFFTLGRLLLIFHTEIKIIQRLVMIYKFAEAVLMVALFGLWAGENPTKSIVIPIYILLGSYLLRMIYAYKINKFKDNQFVNDINCTVLLLRALILTQVILVLVQVLLEKPMPWFVALIPAWGISIILIVFTINLFKNVYFVCGDEVWGVDTSEQKKAAFWIFGNLFILISLVLCISALVALVYDGYLSESSRPLLWPFIAIVVWYPFSPIWAFRMQVRIPKFMLEVGLALEAERNDYDKVIKYVIKVSNTFYKTATRKDIDQLNSKKVSKSRIGNDPEVQESLKRMPTESVNCMICCSSLSNAVFLGCGHGGVCFDCGKDIKEKKSACHMCRKNVTSVLKIDVNINNTRAVYYKIVSGVVKKK